MLITDTRTKITTRTVFTGTAWRNTYLIFIACEMTLHHIYYIEAILNSFCAGKGVIWTASENYMHYQCSDYMSLTIQQFSSVFSVHCCYTHDGSMIWTFVVSQQRTFAYNHSFNRTNAHSDIQSIQLEEIVPMSTNRNTLYSLI